MFSFDLLSTELAALAQVLFINVVLSGDNAIVVGMAAAGVDAKIRRKVILWGIGGAVVLRIGFSIVATRLLEVVGLTLAGGVLLLWVSWKMFREIRADARAEREAGEAVEAAFGSGSCDAAPAAPGKTFRQAMIQIIVADLSMSLDNVLAVAGAAREHVGVLIIGLLLSVALMGTAANLIAGILTRFRWIAWIGLAMIFYVAVDMIHRGSLEVCTDLTGATCRIGDLAGVVQRLAGG
ncbi:TerC family protein [Siculibacillus lacustris]|uniref:TerC family protein n=1 Tax=Siculibacillus lacustris TaxID=1549641 RepID=A0A4Q9VSL4_9HYPH|nr:TerC family protein [Siculibacillus lacustris]TBW39011.1 TerC family protein [Siculibacillus lacustris]